MRLFDLHADTLTVCQKNNTSLSENEYHIDWKRGCQSYDNWWQVLAIYVSDNMDETVSWCMVNDCVAFLKQEASCDKKDIRVGYEDGGECAVRMLPALENARAIGDDIERIAILSMNDFAYITVTWNGSNRLGNGCLSGNKEGLTAFGKQAIVKMYESGVVPDVSHLNECGFWDVAAIANGRPFIASHSVSKAVCDHPRNLTDKQFECIRDVGGLVGLNLCADQLGEQSFERFERHFYHFLSLGGEKCLAIGMDLDGTTILPEWNGILVAERIAEYLQRKNYPNKLIDDVFFENSQAFFMKTLTSKRECIRIGK